MNARRQLRTEVEALQRVFTRVVGFRSPALRQPPTRPSPSRFSTVAATPPNNMQLVGCLALLPAQLDLTRSLSVTVSSW